MTQHRQDTSKHWPPFNQPLHDIPWPQLEGAADPKAACRLARHWRGVVAAALRSVRGTAAVEGKLERRARVPRIDATADLLGVKLKPRWQTPEPSALAVVLGALPHELRSDCGRR